ncbi:MAG: radical SAM protein [Candidatus Scalinduaceae bacterium]
MKPNILFVSLPNVPIETISENLSANEFVTIKNYIPLGILYISSYLKENNELGRVGIVDYVANFEELKGCKNVNDFIVKVALKEVDFTPDIIMFSLMFSVSHIFCMRVVESLRDLWASSTIVIGGVHATNCTEQLLQSKRINYVVRGEGEKALSDFIKQFSHAQTINVKGIYSQKELNSDGAYDICEYIYDLDSIPFPDWDLIAMNLYTQTRYVTVQGSEKDNGNVRSAVIQTTRGCPGKCTFCSQHTVHGRSMRYRTADNVIEEMKLLHERFNVTTFVPNDDMFISKRTRDLDLLERIKKLNIPNRELQFPNGLHINSLSPQVMDAMMDTGAKVVNLAIESGSEYVQKNVIKKRVNLKKAREVVSYLRDRGIYVRCFFIIGFPGETKEQMLETIEYAKSLNADWCDFFLATPLIGTEIYDQFVEMGYIKKDKPAWSRAHFFGRTFDTKEISAAEITELAYRANLECNFINNPNKRSGNYERAISLFESILARYPFHVVAWYSMMECFQALRNMEKVEAIKQEIKELIRTNPLASDMYNKYKDLMVKSEKSPIV